jgi:hypothetical protein
MMPRAEVAGQCGCGRSPTGKCCGWHALTESAYQEKLVEYNEVLKEKKRQDDLEQYRQQATDLWFSNGGSCTGAKGPDTSNIN